MKNRLGRFDLTLVCEDGSEKYLSQGSFLGIGNTFEFYLYNRAAGSYYLERVLDPNHGRVNYQYAPIFNYDTNWINAYITTGGVTPIATTHRFEAQPEEVNLAHREYFRQDQARFNEMERREAQRQAEIARQEEERQRERRPWERVRNFFGRD